MVLNLFDKNGHKNNKLNLHNFPNLTYFESVREYSIIKKKHDHHFYQAWLLLVFYALIFIPYFYLSLNPVNLLINLMSWDFDEPVVRENTNCVKYDLRKEVFGAADIIPMWVADMDFKTPGFIIDALKRRL